MMRLRNGRAWLDLDPNGAAIAEAVLHVGNHPVRPLFQNPWRNDPRPMDNLTRHLGGEWPCVPFGVPDPPSDLPIDWKIDDHTADWHQHAHGFAAHSVWSLTQLDEQNALAEITYPASGPISSLKRTICLASENEIRLSLDIHPRADTRIPVGVHPVLSLADAAPGEALLRIAGQDTAWTFPIDVEPGRSHVLPDQRGVSLSSLATTNGPPVDAHALPFPTESEDLVMLTDPGGRVSLLRPELGYQVDVTWDASALPSCLLWLSNRGRHYAPWDNRVCAVGIEPVAAAFDLGVGHSRSSETPLSRSGIQTAVDLHAGTVWQTSYAITARPL